MTDQNPRANGDDRRIDLSVEYEVLYWAQRFGISPNTLREVVRGTGPALRDVMRKIWYVPRE